MNQVAKTKNTAFAAKLLLIVVGMFGFGYALVPLYDVFCKLTGLNGKVGVEAAANTDFVVDPTREITLEFITSVNEDTPLKFGAKTSKIKVVPGKAYRVDFWAENLITTEITGQAVPSVTPGLASKYLKKTECFCFNDQEFGPAEKKIMPVRFVIDPALPKRYKTVTLAYTFFDVSEGL